MAEDFDFELDMDDAPKQEDKQPQQPEVDEDLLALARALKKAKEDPETRRVLAAALGVQEQPQPQPAQPVVDPREEELKQKREQAAQLQAEIAQLPPDDPKRQELLAQLVLLNTEIARLEPLVEVGKQMSTMQAAQLALTRLQQHATQLLMSDPRYATLTPEQKQAVLSGVQNGLFQLYSQSPDQLNHPAATQFVEMMVRNLAFEYLIPKPPHDPGVNQPGQPGEQIPRDLLEQAKADGIDPKLLLEELKSLRGEQ